MLFMRHQLYPKKTTSNVDIEDTEDGFSCEMDKTSPAKKRKSKEKVSDMIDMNLCLSIDKVANAIGTSSKDVLLPPLPKYTEIESCMTVIACRFEQIPRGYVSRACQELLGYSMKILEKYI